LIIFTRELEMGEVREELISGQATYGSAFVAAERLKSFEHKSGLLHIDDARMEELLAEANAELIEVPLASSNSTPNEPVTSKQAPRARKSSHVSTTVALPSSSSSQPEHVQMGSVECVPPNWDEWFGEGSVGDVQEVFATDGAEMLDLDELDDETREMLEL
jgi:hypothetical protein